MKQKINPAKTEKHEIVINRNFNATRQMVWKALTEPNWIRQWWGPKDFTAPVIQNELRVGGKYLYCMRSPDGKNYWSTGTFREIDAPAKLVYTDSFADEKGNTVSPAYYGFGPDFPQETMVAITLEDLKDKTRLTLMGSGPPSEKDCNDEIAGWNQSFDKMAEVLGKSKTRI